MNLETYSISQDESEIQVNITEEGGVKRYEIVSHPIPAGTRALLDKIKLELISTLRISTEEILDPKKMESLQQRFRQQASLALDQKLPGLEHKNKNFLIMNLFKEMLGLGDIEILLNDPHLEEIVISTATEPVRVYHRKYGWLQTNITLPSEEIIKDYINTIGRRVGRQASVLHPLLDAHLLSGDRANAVFYPISSKGNTLTIRKFARDPWTITDFMANNTCTPELFALIWFAIQYESNILISGGTGSGKTSLLNVCMPFIPPNQRIVSIEDTRELSLPEFLYWSPLTTRLPNPEGKGEVSMLDLLINSLRMRPDRIILGEMRKKDQAEVLFEAMHTGHSVYATVHADSVMATIQRLTNPPIDIPPYLLGAVNLNVVMFRDRRQNIRRVFQVGEFLSAEEQGRKSIKGNIIYRWNPSNDTIIPHNKNIRLFEELSRHTGLSEAEIPQELVKKEKILQWMVKHKVRDIHSVGKIMNDYYLDPEKLYQKIQKNALPPSVLEG